MNDPRGPRRPRSERADEDVARGASFAAAKGAALIGVAVILGIVLLQVVDDGSSGTVATGTKAPSTTTTTVASSTTTPSTVPERNPEDVRVLVLNGGAPSGSAGNMAAALNDVGYVNQPVKASDDDQTRTGNAVMCRAGFEQEAVTLATFTGDGTEILPFRDPAPPESDQADCVVIVGAPSGG